MANTTDDPKEDGPDTEDATPGPEDVPGTAAGKTDPPGDDPGGLAVEEDEPGSPEVADAATEEVADEDPFEADPEPLTVPEDESAPTADDPAEPGALSAEAGAEAERWDPAAAAAWMPAVPDPEPSGQTHFAPAPERVEPCEAGLFGKLPARGDFVARALDRDLMRSLEDWLLPLVQGTRDVLGQGWAAAWGQAPGWRFWIGPGVLAGEWQRDFRSHARKAGGAITGVLLPSADKHGRLFPLAVILADRHARLMPPPVLAPPDRAFYAACDALLQGARDGRDLDTVEADLAALAAPRRAEMAEAMEDLLVQQSLWAQTTTHDSEGHSGVWADIRAPRGTAASGPISVPAITSWPRPTAATGGPKPPGRPVQRGRQACSALPGCPTRRPLPSC
jgi:type VI secretion system ImpM family protein